MPPAPAPATAARDDEYQVSDSEDDEFEDEIDEEDDKDTVNPLKDSLQKPRHGVMSCKQLHDMIHEGNVDLNPEYQRDVVWPEAKMIGLIQSLFLNFYVPPVIFATTHDDETGNHWTTIDGKQRLTSIRRFMDGEIPFKAPDGSRYWYRSGTGRGKTLSKALRNRFDTTSIVVVEFDNISDTNQRDIFQRVQLGVPLSTPEKLQAIVGPWSDWIAEMLKKYVHEEGTIASYLNMDYRRAKPFQTVLAMVLICYQPERLLKPPTATEEAKFLSRTDGPDDGFRRKMEMAMSILVNITVNFHTAAFETTQAKVLAPVEFYHAGFLIFQRMGTTPVPALAKQIGNMRIFVRSKNKDIFSNAKVTRTFYEFFEKLPPWKLGPNEQVAAAEWDGEEHETSGVLARKRRREARELEDDPDYRGAPIARTGLSNTTASAAQSLRSRDPPPAYQPARITRPPVATMQSVRPPPSSMDAGPSTPGGALANGNGHNPYRGSILGAAEAAAQKAKYDEFLKWKRDHGK